MDAKEYKEKKLDKLTRDVVQMVNKVPSFGYGEVVDNVAKTALTSYLVTMVRMSELQESDIEILAQSMSDELESLTLNLVTKIKTYKKDIEENS